AAARGLERGEEGAQAPDAAEVVRLDEADEALGLDVEEAVAARDAGVADEDAYPRMPLANRGRRPLHGLAVGDVAELVLAAELLGQRAEPVLAPGEEDAEVAARREGAGDRGADPARGAGDDGDAALGAQRQTRTRSRALAVLPFASRTRASRTWAPRFARAVRQFAA